MSDAAPETPPPAEPDIATQLVAAQGQRDEYLTLLKQTQADFDNYQKRNARDREAERKYAMYPLALDLLPALDSLERAIEAAKKAGDEGPLTQGVTGTQRMLLDTLRRHGVTPVDPTGSAFDPNKHQAIAQQPSPDHPAGTVLMTHQQGFMMHDRVLRPAAVVVST